MFSNVVSEHDFLTVVARKREREQQISRSSSSTNVKNEKKPVRRRKKKRFLFFFLVVPGLSSLPSLTLTFFSSAPRPRPLTKKPLSAPAARRPLGSPASSGVGHHDLGPLPGRVPCPRPARASAVTTLGRGQRPLRHDVVDLRQDPLERLVDVGRLQRARLDEAEPLALAEGRGVLGAHGAQVPQVGLVPDERDDDVGVGVVAQLLEPPLDVLESLRLGDVVDQQRADRAAVVGRRDRAVPLLARRVPDLGFHGLAVDGDRAGRELDADSRLGLEAELVAGEAGEEVGLADARVADQDDLEEVVVAVFFVFFF